MRTNKFEQSLLKSLLLLGLGAAALGASGCEESASVDNPAGSKLASRARLADGSTMIISPADPRLR